MNNQTYEDMTSSLDLLYSMSDTEIHKCFHGYNSLQEVLDDMPISKICEMLDQYYNSESEISDTQPDHADNEIHSFDWYLRRAKGYTEEELKTIKSPIKGVIAWTNSNSKTALIFKREKGTVRKFFAPLSNKLSRTLFAGDVVLFIPEKGPHDANTAVNIEKTGHVCSRRDLVITPYIVIDAYKIIRYGIKNAYSRLIMNSHMSQEEFDEKMEREGVNKRDFSYIYIRTPRKEYKIFEKTSPIKGDARVDNLQEFLQCLNLKILGISINSSQTMITLEEYENNRQKKKEQTENNELLQKKIQGYIDLVQGILIQSGVKDVKEKIKAAGLQKKIKKGKIDIQKTDPKTVAGEIKGKGSYYGTLQDYRQAFYVLVKGYIKLAGYTDKEAKKMIRQYKLSEKISNGEFDRDEPKNIAEMMLEATAFSAKTLLP